MTARSEKARRSARRRSLALALGGAAFLGAALLLARNSRERQSRAERSGRERAQAEAREERRRAALGEERAWLARALARFQGPPARAGELLAALARATPAAITLQTVTTEGDTFVIRGQVHATGGGPDDPLLRFRRELCPAGAAWEIPDPPSPGPADFTWRGFFPRPAAPPDDAAALTAQLAAARAALRPAETFEAQLRAWGRHWKILAHSAEREPGLEVRHYVLAFGQPRLSAWSEVVQTVQQIGAEPGLTLDSLILSAAPDGADAFSQAQLTLTARLCAPN